jgi:hypothetical protein
MDCINSTTIFYCLVPVKVNQDQVVRATPANCCVTQTFNLRRAPYFYGAFCQNEDDSLPLNRHHHPTRIDSPACPDTQADRNAFGLMRGIRAAEPTRG